MAKRSKSLTSGEITARYRAGRREEGAVKVEAWIPADMIEALDKIQAEEGPSRAFLIRKAVREFLSRR